MRRLAVACAPLLLLMACGSDDDDAASTTTVPPGDGATTTAPVPALEGTTTVFAAASLTDAFEEVGSAFEDANPEVTVELNFAASSALREQILSGAPADVFASANTSNMDQVIEGVRLRESKGVVPPRFVVEKVIDQIEGFLAPGPAGTRS